ncbi:hypothetical protein EEL31_23720 [Brevibacillus laterosporus]|nr:hypothetical protein [Brevibacillus laterosporus]TPG71140.1 hypothetical protein EEL31_23720 [Brevibacillus laterosporus]
MALTIFLIVLIALITILLIYRKKTGFFGGQKLIHVTGLENIQQGEEVNFSAYKDKIVINNKITLPLQRVKKTQVYDGQQILEYEKSVIKRALIGGLITGGIGAIVGGLSGIGTKKKVQELVYLSVEFVNKNEQEQALLFAVADPSLTVQGTLNQMSKKFNKIIGYKPEGDSKGQIVL